ncbi:hypothetical protein HBH56_134100 [Parastagonospora nodorum]|nr:hypothetical protein HBH56_134100 [Parastagonospora nodorum]KAH3927073.1 hypothetical protein HBH54_159190 [Parastagonospora nodorum]KAH3949376.1 hypothetical protein HBH53_089160 [Parastagonospora nodorum]KAH3958791.1 hypothetical protein HBH51_204320 [Parastagonospora nodorum]KAH3974764.1 hypothetical protein HBH52_132580 [Parastagonospora nodorum]
MDIPLEFRKFTLFPASQNRGCPLHPFIAGVVMSPCLSFAGRPPQIASRDLNATNVFPPMSPSAMCSINSHSSEDNWLFVRLN